MGVRIYCGRKRVFWKENSFEKLTGMRVAVQERAGNALKHLAKSEPLKSRGCGRIDCFICTSGGAGNCEKNGSGYLVTCETCLRAGRLSCYDGETDACVENNTSPASG